MCQEIAAAPSLYGLVPEDELSAPNGKVERPEDESVQRRVALALIAEGLPPDASCAEVIGSTKTALERSGIPIALYEQAVQQPGFQQLLVELHNIYVLVPQTTSVVQAMAKKARTGDGGSIDRFFKHLNSTDQDAKDEVRRLEARGGIEAVLSAVEAQHAKLEQIARDVSSKADVETLKEGAMEKILTRDDAFSKEDSVDHAAVFARGLSEELMKREEKRNNRVQSFHNGKGR